MVRLSEEAEFDWQYVPLLRDDFSTEATGKDCSGYGRATFALSVGATDTTVDLKVQESDDDSTYTDISGAAITQLGATDDNSCAVIEVDMRPGVRKKFLRAVLTVGDGTNGADTAVLLMLDQAASKPTSHGADDVVRV